MIVKSSCIGNNCLTNSFPVWCPLDGSILSKPPINQHYEKTKIVRFSYRYSELETKQKYFISEMCLDVFAYLISWILKMILQTYHRNRRTLVILCIRNAQNLAHAPLCLCEMSAKFLLNSTKNTEIIFWLHLEAYKNLKLLLKLKSWAHTLNLLSYVV